MASLLIQLQKRTTASFFNRKTADHLWKSVTTVSKAGRQKGRAKSVPKAVNLNRGQELGRGQVNMIWPGLNAPPSLRDDTLQPKLLPPDNKFMDKLTEIRDIAGKKRRGGVRIHPLERGWTGNKIPGKVLPPPEPLEDEASFEGFQTVCLEMKRVMRMTSNGRTPRMSAFVVTGNKNGLIGWGLSKAIEHKAALRKAISRASKQLVFVELYEGHTIFQDFYAECNASRLFVQRKPKGHGLRCHRCIKSICETVGIKDIRVKVEGSTKNYQAITKAFICGLIYQETYQQLAERKGLHVVEMRPETGYIPKIVASPKQTSVRTSDEIEPNEILDVEELYSVGRYPFMKPPPPPPYANAPHVIWAEKKRFPFRNMHDVTIQLIADGEISYFTKEEQKDWGVRKHQMLLNNEIPLPKGLGLSDVCRDLHKEEQKD